MSIQAELLGEVAGHVESLHTYPIKSCGGIEHQTLEFTDYGPKGDRQFIVVRAKSLSMLTQRTDPRLALVETSMIDAQTLAIVAPGAGSITLDLERLANDNKPENTIEVFKKSGTGVEVSKANDLLSSYLGKATLLMRSAKPREVNPRYRSDELSYTMGFADGSPVLLISMASLTELNMHLVKPVDASAFRANAVIGGDRLKAFDEDNWAKLTLGQLAAGEIWGSPRCPIPNIEQRPGIYDAAGNLLSGVLGKDRPVTEVLRATRHGINTKDGGEGDFFGINLMYHFVQGITVSKGDLVSVVERSSEPNVQLVNV